MLNTPILFLIFNRPDETQRVFKSIQQAQPKQLFIAADGPRINLEGEKEKCTAVRAIIKQVDWDCELKLLFRKENLGCGKAVSSAISWFFENVEMGIILEDDCLPHPDFFPFCEELLNRFKNNLQVMHIGSTNYQDGIKRGEGSYYFSENVEIWGWATWKRAWNLYNFSLTSLSSHEIIKTIERTSLNKDEKRYWISIFHKMKNNPHDTWDYQYVYSIMSNNGVCILPNRNLVSNIGFGENATHTTKRDIKHADRKVYPILPLCHPIDIYIDQEADKYYFYNYVHSPLSPFYEKIIIKFIKIIKRFSISAVKHCISICNKNN